MRILLFAHVKDAIGTGEFDLKINGEVDAAEVWRQIIGARSGLAPFQKTTRLARNGEYADAHARFTDADEVALIPPVSGG
jgi:molybdopterin converting factor subunit 1